jgi:hypothetical protein
MNMNRNRITVLLVVLLASLTALAAHAQSGAQQSFDSVKALAGNWEGKTQMSDPVQVSFRLTAGGSAVMSEIVSQMNGKSEDMITMFNMDGDRLLLTHYCEAGNQPRMKASASADGKTLTFDFLDATNLSSPDAPHMHRVVFSFIDGNHHTEEWHFAVGGKEMVETFDLQKKS